MPKAKKTRLLFLPALAAIMTFATANVAVVSDAQAIPAIPCSTLKQMLEDRKIKCKKIVLKCPGRNVKRVVYDASGNLKLMKRNAAKKLIKNDNYTEVNTSSGDTIDKIVKKLKKKGCTQPKPDADTSVVDGGTIMIDDGIGVIGDSTISPFLYEQRDSLQIRQ
jgi:hypothetical protein